MDVAEIARYVGLAAGSGAAAWFSARRGTRSTTEELKRHTTVEDQVMTEVLEAVRPMAATIERVEEVVLPWFEEPGPEDQHETLPTQVRRNREDIDKLKEPTP